MSELFVVVGENIETLTKNDLGLWADSLGTIWAISESSDSIDSKDRCGIGILSLPQIESFEDINKLCSVHDYMYSSRAYQTFYARKEADEYLRKSFLKNKYPILGNLFYGISRIFGGRFWEVKSAKG